MDNLHLVGNAVFPYMGANPPTLTIAALALRLVEAMTIRENRSQRPLILLDDVFAELDGGRSERVLELLEADDCGQVVLTAPKEADVKIRKDALPRWRIEAGRITT